MKKGFTLIELLAVIVILAIIALIAVPIVINIINDSKKESLQRSIDLYVDTVQKRVTQENMKVKYDPDRCEIQTNGNVKCYKGEDALKTSKGNYELEIEMNGKKPTEGEITFNNNKISYENVLLDLIYYHMNEEGKKETTTDIKLPLALETEDYKGYYADVDGDGTPDGVIYADLAYAKEETSWGISNTSYAKYSYAKETGLKEYTVSKETYKKNEGFGTKPIISVKSGSSGNSRFYVMALNDFTTEAYTDPNDSNNNYPAYTTYYWYYGAFGNMSPLITSNNFGDGKENTRKMIAKWNAAGTNEGYADSPQNNRDIWKHIQTKYQEGWYIPSLGELTAFADYFTNKTDLETKLTTSNYNSNYGLSPYYWSSSQYNTIFAWFATFYNGYVLNFLVTNGSYVRLGATF